MFIDDVTCDRISLIFLAGRCLVAGDVEVSAAAAFGEKVARRNWLDLRLCGPFLILLIWLIEVLRYGARAWFFAAASEFFGLRLKLFAFDAIYSNQNFRCEFCV